MNGLVKSFLDSNLFEPTAGVKAMTDPWVVSLTLLPAVLAICIPTILSFWPHDGQPQKHTPRGPPDEATWRDMSFMERVTHVVRDVAAHSLDVGLVTYWKHIRFWIAGCAFNVLTLAVVPRPGDMSLDEWMKQACIKTVILHMVGEGMGFFKQGPLWGNRVWPDSWKYLLTVGTIKQTVWGASGGFEGFWGPAGEQEGRYPMMQWIFGGTKRTVLDCTVHFLFIALSLTAQFLPRVPMWWIWAITATCTHCMIWDFHLWLQRVGYTYMYFLIAACFPTNQGALAGMQLVMLFQRLGCGIGKLGPWFCYVIGLFVQTHPTCKDSENYRSLIHNGPDDFGPSKFVKRLGYFSELWETFWPATVMLTFCPLVCRIGLAGLVAMHTFIIIAPAMIDVVMWNVAFIVGDLWLFGYASCGFSYTSLSEMHPLLACLLLADLTCTTLLMQYPKTCSRYFRHAHYTGNWPQMSYLIRKTAAVKLDSKIKTFGNKAWDVISQPGIENEYKMYKGLAYSWLMNLDAKIFPKLFDMALGYNDEVIENYYILGGHHILEYVCGAGCDGQQGPRMARFLAKECDFQPGDLMVIWIWPFPVFKAWSDPLNCKAEWEIQDSTQEAPIARGEVPMHRLQACDALPTDAEKLLPCLPKRAHSSENSDSLIGG